MDDYIYPNQEILLPVANYSYYITKEGDTLNSVSALFRKNIEYLIRENETIYLMPGQVLVSLKK
jgi:LysM repeat protein